MINNITFEQIQKKYESPNFLGKLKKNVLDKRSQFHHISIFLTRSIQVPELVQKTTQTCLQILSFHPAFELPLKKPLQLLKEAKEYINLIKGLQSIDSLIHLKAKDKKLLLFNLSGFALLILSGLTISEKFKLIDLTAIKTTLTAVPIFGCLPYAGVLDMSVIGLLSGLILILLGKNKVLSLKKRKILQDKIEFWKAPLTHQKIQLRKIIYNNKTIVLENSLASIKKLILIGKKFKKNYKADLNKLEAYKKAQEELSQAYKAKKSELKVCLEKKKQWENLEKKFDRLRDQSLLFQKAKLKKWNIKLNKIDHEKHINVWAVAKNALSLLNQVLSAICTVTGYGRANYKFIKVALNILNAACSLYCYYSKKSLIQYRIKSVALDEYLIHPKR